MNYNQRQMMCVLGFLFCLVYNLCFPPFFSVWPLAFTFNKMSFGGNLQSHFDPWNSEQKEPPPLHFLTSHPLGIIFSIIFFSFFFQTGSSLLHPQFPSTPSASEEHLQCAEAVQIPLTQLEGSGVRRLWCSA